MGLRLTNKICTDPTALQANSIMDNYQQSGWKYLQKMEEIFPEGGATGAQAFHGATTMSALPSTTSDAAGHESNHPESIAATLGSSNIVNIDPQLIDNAITSTTTVINSLAPSISSSSSELIQSSSNTRSSSRKRPLSSLSPDESGTSGNSLLFSPMQPPISTASTTSFRSSGKHSRTSGGRGATSGVKKDTTTIALHAVDSSIRLLHDLITKQFVDPLKCVQDALKLLSQLPDEYRRFMRLQFTLNPATAVTYLSTPEVERLDYVTDLYTAANPGAGSLGQ